MTLKMTHDLAHIVRISTLAIASLVIVQIAWVDATSIVLSASLIDGSCVIAIATILEIALEVLGARHDHSCDVLLTRMLMDHRLNEWLVVPYLRQIVSTRKCRTLLTLHQSYSWLTVGVVWCSNTNVATKN